MAGNLFRATQRTGGLQPVLDLFRSIQQEREKKDYYNNLADLAGRTQRNISEIKGGFDPNMTFMPGRGSSVNQAQPFDTKNLLGIDPNLISDTPQVPLRPSRPQEPQIDAGTPGDYLLGDALLNQEGTGYDRKKMYNLAGDELRNSLLQMISDENADLPRVNALGNLLGNEVASMKPGQMTPINQNVKAFIDDDGKIVQNPFYERTTSQRNPLSKVGNDGYIHHWDENENKYTKTNLRAKEEKTEKVEKLPDVSKNIAEAREGIKKIKDLKSTRKATDKGSEYRITGEERGETGYKKGKLYPINEEEFGKRRNKLKQQYTKPIIEAVQKRGLQEAIDVIREESEKRGMKSLDKIENAIDSFIRVNPDYSTDKETLKAYFELFLL